MELVAGTIIAGRYTLERLLGRGATAVVWLATDAQTTTRVALKVLVADLARDTDRGRFLREIRRTAQFAHPRILPVLDAGEDGELVWFAMPWMQGGTLRELLQRERQLPVAQVLQLGITLADALAHAHRHGFVHLDVKPENVLFHDGEAHLADFGICRALERTVDETSTSLSLIRGTPAYMSPEQAAGEADINGRSDIFSLGCVLYEALAGVATYIGPTSAAVLAQRFTHPPRDLRVYRPQVPESLERIVARCLRVTAADRYQNALDLERDLSAVDPSSAPRPGPTDERPLPTADASAPRARRLRTIGVAIAATIVVASWLVVAPPGSRGSADAAPVDTTRVAVWPFAAADGAPAGAAARHTQMLRDALARWDGVELVDQFQVEDALQRESAPPTLERVAALTRRLGAGRFVRGRVTVTDGRTHTQVVLYDINGPVALLEARAPIADAVPEATRTLESIAAQLLLRAPGPEVDAFVRRGTARSVPAAQAWLQAQASLREWDLARADAEFAAVTAAMPTDAAAQLWLAQVRAWRGRPVDTWAGAVARATAGDTALGSRERVLRVGLQALADGDFERACRHYAQLAQRSSGDFAAWFGLGQCRTLDRVVVRDSTSPSGWRFRASRHAAIAAYERAFALLPTVYRGYEGSAFEGLRELLFLSNRAATGFSLPDSARFFARPAWRGDTLAFVPVPFATFIAGGGVPEGFHEAIARQRQRFRAIAAGWSLALPRSSEAKEALAIALELLANPAAIDTLRAARRLSTDPTRQLALAFSEVRLLLRFGLPDDPTALRRAATLADSLLRHARAETPADHERLAAMAAVVGDCDAGGRHAVASIPAAGFVGIPASILQRSQEQLMRIALRCVPAVTRTEIEGLATRADLLARTGGSGRGPMLNVVLLYRPTLLHPAPGVSMLERIVASSDTPLARAALALARGDTAAARGLVASQVELPLGEPPRTPDLALALVQLAHALGDSATAERVAADAVQQVRDHDPSVLDDPVSVAALITILDWSVNVAPSRASSPAVRRWRDALAAIRSSHTGGAE